MIGDKLILQPYHLPPAREIFNRIEDKKEDKRMAITIAGESGSGKSTLAIALKKVCDEQDMLAFIFHMDDYFYLPPTSNHIQRLEDINHVGPQEVNMQLLQSHIDQFLEGEEFLEKPLVHYKENEIRTELVDLNQVGLIIIEGTYTTLLDNINCKIFMSRDYRETLENRINRNRDPISPFIEDVLEIEHQIIRKHRDLAHILVDNDYKVYLNE